MGLASNDARRRLEVARKFARAINSAAVVDAAKIQRIWGGQFDPGFAKPLDFELHLVWLCFTARVIYSERKDRDLAIKVVMETQHRWWAGRTSPRPFTPSTADKPVKKVFVNRYLQRLTGYGRGDVDVNVQGLTGSFFSGAAALLLERFYGQVADDSIESPELVVPIPAQVNRATTRYLEQSGTALFLGSTFQRYVDVKR